MRIAISDYQKPLLCVVRAFLTTGSILLGSCGTDNKYLVEVDRAIEMRERHIAQKEHLIEELKLRFSRTPEKERQYEILMDIYQKYQYFSLDSAFVYLGKAISLSEELGDTARITDARISLAFLYNFAGMLSESMDIFRDIQVDNLSPPLRRNYYYLGFNLYNSLGRNAISPEKILQSERLKKCYRDSALVYCTDDIILVAEKMNDSGDTDRAIALLTGNLTDNLTTDEAGLRYYVLSEIYRNKNDTDNQIKYLAMSSVASINNGVRQYISLRKLAELLYHQGDIDRAYRYIHQCLDDAKACNSHSRILEASAILPIIDSAVFVQKQRRRNYFIVALSVITLMLLSLIYVSVKLHRNNSRLSLSQCEQKKSNGKLKLLNEKLQESNRCLSAVNSELIKTQKEQEVLNERLHESDRIKTEYITRFMNLCLEYIDKMENYRTHLSKVAARRNLEVLCETIHSTRYINREAGDFYKHFDEAFLNIYPTFINNINALLIPAERIVLKEKGRLTTELRIYALMKLGITDGAKIQKFLRCSASTVYNYRSNMRNKALDRASFEDDIARV